MKKLILLLGCLTLTAACQVAATKPVSISTPTTTLRPTPISATTVPTVAPLPTPPLYFTEEFDTASTFWEFFQTGGTNTPLATFENGMLRIDSPAPHTWYLGIHTVHTYSNIFITAQSSLSPTGSIGLICRYDASKGWFEFNVASDGTYSVLFGQWLAPDIAQYRPIATDSIRHFDAGNLNYEIGLSCQDNSLLWYVNGELLRKKDVERFELSEGNIGITAASFQEAPMTAIFKWVKVDEQ